MEIKRKRFIVPGYDIRSDKKTLISKMFQNRYSKEYDNITDYAVLNGVKVKLDVKGQKYGSYWIANTKDVYEGPMDMIAYGPDYTLQATSSFRSEANVKDVGIRPFTTYSEIKDEAKIIETYVYPKVFLDEVYHIIEYGEYPQDIADNDKQILLEKMFNNNLLNRTGRTFSRDIGNPSKGMYCIEDDEYEYDGNKYIRVENLNIGSTLSNGQNANASHYWIKVQPVKWVVDVNDDKVWSDKILIGGVAYNGSITACYENTYISSFMDHYFTRDINQKTSNNKTYPEQNIIEQSKPKRHKVKVRRIR